MKFIYGSQVTTSFECIFHCFVIYSYSFCIIIEHSRLHDEEKKKHQNNRCSIRWCKKHKVLLKMLEKQSLYRRYFYQRFILTHSSSFSLSLSMCSRAQQVKEKTLFTLLFFLMDLFVCIWFGFIWLSCCYFWFCILI